MNAMDINTLLVASLPIVYMLHDFEEIIMMKSWAKSNEKYISQRFQRIAPRLISHLREMSVEGFALCVAILFLLLGFVTLTALWTGFYLFWMGIFMAFSIHIVVHIIQWIAFQRYIPAIVTSLLCVPYCIYGIICIKNTFEPIEILIYTLTMSVVLMVFLYAGHRYLARLI
jgi:hypothetical protein